MIKAINIESTNNAVVRVLSIAEPEVMENNPTNRTYFLIHDFIDPPILDNPLAINYPMYDKTNKQFKWVHVQYQNTVTEELLAIENLKAENNKLKNELQTANENINMLLELQADLIGGAV